MVIKNSRVLVTGGAGFIGSHLIDHLLKFHNQVVILDNFYNPIALRLEPDRFNGIKLLRGDIRDIGTLVGEIGKINYVFHLAAIVGTQISMKDPSLTHEVNVTATLNLLRTYSGSKLRRLVFSSSAAVYGEPRRTPIPEDERTFPLSPYGVSKLAAEQYCRAFNLCYGLKSTVLRIFNVYGPGQGQGPYSGVITNFIDALTHEKAATIYGDGNQTRDFVYIDDVVNGLIAAADSEEAVGEVINIGSGSETMIKELLAKTSAILGSERVEPAYEKARLGDIRASCANIEKARKILDYVPNTSLEDGLRKYLMWFKSGKSPVDWART